MHFLETITLNMLWPVTGTCVKRPPTQLVKIQPFTLGKTGINNWPNVKKVPDLPYEGDKRQDDPFHWGTGQFAALVGMSFKPKAVFLVGIDLWGLGKEQKPENVNNIYKGSKGYTYIKRPVDPSYWIYQFSKLFEHSECRWIIVNQEGWKMPEEWNEHKNVFQDTYEGLAKWINNQLTKK